jgi:hypothetical protein
MNTAKSYAVLIGVGAVALVGLAWLARKQIAAAASAAGGLVTGNNALTEGTAYEGAGVVGTLGAAANSASGGALGDFGSWLGGAVYDITHPTLQTRKQATGDNFWVNTNTQVFTP